MRSPSERAEILALVERGINDCEIARRTGLPRTTVRDIRRPRPGHEPRGGVCPRCWWRRAPPMQFSDGDYAELLAVYLGDGSIVRTPRTYRLRISLDSVYPGIIDE